MNIVEEIIRANTGRLNKTAVLEKQVHVSFGDLFDTVDRWAAQLRDLGFAPGDRVALLGDDSASYVAMSLAVMKIEAVIVPISRSYALHETAGIVERMDVAWVLTMARPLPEYGPVETLGSSHLWARDFSLQRRRQNRPHSRQYLDSHAAFIRFSSGTTGQSKGVLISHEAVLERTTAADRMLQIREDDTVLWLLSMSFHFVVTILLFLRRGATLDLCTETFPDDLLESLQAGRGTFIYASPYHYQTMAQSPDFRPDCLKNIRMAVSTAIGLPAPVGKSFQEKFGFSLCQAYGIIEVGLPCIQTPEEERRSGAVGRVGKDYELKLLPDGEILFRGRGMFHAYFSPWKKRTDLDPDGWFHTGDLGFLDADGFLYIQGRKKEVINFAGMKIFPAEVEGVLNDHPAVLESCVYGLPDETFGQLPVAQVVLRKNEFDENDIRRFCYRALPSFKVPKTFEVVPELEKTASGKIKRS